MCTEYALIVNGRFRDDGGIDGVVEPGMVLCIESFAGGREGVKLEPQTLVTEHAPGLLSTRPQKEQFL